jgi:hypothetical protein
VGLRTRERVVRMGGRPCGEERREVEGRRSSPRWSKSNDHRLQNLGHHRGERESWRRGGCCAGKFNERKEEKGEGAHGGEAGALGRAGQSGPGWVASRGKNPRHTQPQIGIQLRNEIRNETRQNMRLNTTSDQRNMIRHDATLMST